jgi:predicted cupin superfamily sugar epimerase
MTHQSARTLIDGLGLILHPEGGYFKEIYRSGATPMASQGKTDPEGRLMAAEDRDGGSRNEMTSIYWMATKEYPILIMGENISPHVHYYHSGGPFVYHLIHPDGRCEEVVMGPDPTQGHVMQMVVPSHVMKAGVLKDGAEYFLVGEGVSPGFDFRDFKFTKYADIVTRVGQTKADEMKELGVLYKDPSLNNFDSYYEKKSDN